MACIPYNPAAGLFINNLGWGLTSSGLWSFGLKPGSTDMYQLKQSGTVKDEIWIPDPDSVRWIFFPTGNFLAVRNATTSGGFDSYRIWIFDLRGSTVSHYEVGSGPWTLSTGGQLHFHPSQDGLAFFMFESASQPNSTEHHVVFRSDSGAGLCSWGPITNVMAQRLAEITSAKSVRIMTSPGTGGPTVYTTCPLPSGNCDVQPDSQIFPEAVVDGPVSLATTTREYSVKNTGTDCLTVNSITNAPPFTVTATSKTLPADLIAGGSMTVTITFAPGTVGTYGPTDLVVSCTPQNGDDKIRCTGTARDPIRKLTLIPTALSFGKHPVNSSNSLAVKMRNDGEVALLVTVAGSPAGIPFTWASFNGTIAVGSSQDITVTFTPVSEGLVSATLIVNDVTSGASYNIPISGSGCIANAEIIVPTTPFPSFGTVHRGFRIVRYIIIQNTGDGPLTFSARINGADKELFGLVQDPPAESIVNVVNTRSYTVDPVTLCGPGSVGSGVTTVAVVFFANDIPRITSAHLILEGHNATNTAVSSFTYSLTAEIVPPIAVDAALVLDRSGSMSQTIGARIKAEAAAAGGKLFAELVRPDLDDRLTVVKYDEIIDVLQPIVSVTSANQPGIVSRINTTELAPRGITCIAGGIVIAREQLAVPRGSVPADLTAAMVVLTDGMDNTGFFTNGQWYTILGGNAYNPAGGYVTTQALPMPAGIKIYGIGLGREEDIDKAALNRISTATGGYSGVVSDLIGQTYFDLEKYFVQIYMDMASTSPISDPVYTIMPGQHQKIEFDILKGDVGALIVIFDHNGQRLPFRIVTPIGEIMDGISAPSDFQLRIGSTPTARFVEFLMPAKQPERYAGRWSVIVEHRGEVCSGKVGNQTDMRPGFLPFKCEKSKKPVDYGIAIGAGSNFRMQPYVTPAPLRVGDPILLTAVVTEAGLPVTGCTVTVKAVAPSGASWNLTLLDDGAHDDGDSDDGEYARLFGNTGEGGTYEFIFRAVGMSRDGEPVVREAVRSKYVEGRIVIEPHGGRPGDPDPCCERIVKLLQRLIKDKRFGEPYESSEQSLVEGPVKKARRTRKAA